MPSKPFQALLLLILLAMPVFFYLFLQKFGENEYKIPVYYQQGTNPLPGCNESAKPHIISPYFLEDPCREWNCSFIKNKLAVFSFSKAGCSTKALNEVARVCNVYRDQPLFHSVTLAVDGSITKDLVNQQSELYSLPANVWSWWIYDSSVETLVKCGFNLDLDCSLVSQVILVDQEKQIRGYYNADDPEEMDRLVTEFEILIKESN
jgi:protein SCO1/2